MVVTLLSSMDGSSQEVMQGILETLFPATTTVDLTYGRGRFWGQLQPTLMGDLNPNRNPQVVWDYQQLPLKDKSFDVAVFDPPFQPGTKWESHIHTWFSRPMPNVVALKKSICAGLLEANRVARQGVVVKVQDYCHNHKMVWMSHWVWETLGEPFDFVTLRMSSKTTHPKWKTQRSVRHNHTTFWIYSKGKGRR